MVKANFPNILFGSQVQATVGGSAPATPVSDIATGTGVYGIGNNYGGNNGFTVPPDPQLTTFGVTMQNLSGLVNYEVDTSDYMANYTGAGIYPPGWEDYLNFGAYAEDPGSGGASAATSWSWDVTIISQSFSGGAVAVTSGTGVTTQQADFSNNPGTGVGEDVKWSLGRGGSIIAGDNINIRVQVTASNAGGSSGAFVEVVITWV